MIQPLADGVEKIISSEASYFEIVPQLRTRLQLDFLD